MTTFTAYRETTRKEAYEMTRADVVHLLTGYGHATAEELDGIDDQDLADRLEHAVMTGTTGLPESLGSRLDESDNVREDGGEIEIRVTR